MFDVVKQKKLEKRYNNIIQKSIPQHVGIILDGNGRWAKKRKMPRIMGHAMGIKRIEAIIPEVRKLGIQTLTLFAFSTENWNRPQEEVDFLMNEAKKLYERLINRIDELEYNVRVIGEKPDSHPDLLEKIEELNKLGNKNKDFTLCVAFNYGGQKELLSATKDICKLVVDNKIKIDEINESIIDEHLYTKGLPPVDLMIRTSGEMRISNFMLWQNAYAEMYFPKLYWPDFDRKALYDAIEEYQKRCRRFGKIGEEDA